MKIYAFFCLIAMSLIAQAQTFDKKDLKRYLSGMSQKPFAPIWECYLKEHMGKDFKIFDEVGGYYSTEEKDWEGIGLASCPQQGCTAVTVLARENGDLQVSITINEKETTITNLREAANKKKKNVKFVSRDKALVSCWEKKIIEENKLFLAARNEDTPVCHKDYSRFSGDYYINASTKKSWFYSNPNLEKKGKNYVIPGDFLQVAKLLNGFACAKYHSMASQETVGWLKINTLDEVDAKFFNSSKRDEFIKAAQRMEPLGSLSLRNSHWLSLDKVDKIKLSAISPKTLRVDMAVHMAGHQCYFVKQVFQRQYPRSAILLPEQIGRDCGAVLLFFNNAIYAEDNGQCGGARASCAGVFFKLN